MERTQLGTYVNGNTIVAMYSDGTKERYVKDGEVPAPEFPESMDLKITNCCDLGCAMCAECSTPNGMHAELNNTLLETIRPFTELAIGGGNPLSHPGLDNFLAEMHGRNVICNITVNARHFLRYQERIKSLYKSNLIRGLGVSIPTDEYISDELLNAIKKFPNAVVHTIYGVTPMSVYKKLADNNLNVLILGFKPKGNGKSYEDNNFSEVSLNKAQLYESLKDMMPRFKAIAFDNLAVEQLTLRSILSNDAFDRLYMGDDGEFTMYIDLVRMKYGKSSTHPMRDIDATSVAELFQSLKQ